MIMYIIYMYVIVCMYIHTILYMTTVHAYVCSIQQTSRLNSLLGPLSRHGSLHLKRKNLGDPVSPTKSKKCLSASLPTGTNCQKLPETSSISKQCIERHQKKLQSMAVARPRSGHLSIGAQSALAPGQRLLFTLTI